MDPLYDMYEISTSTLTTTVQYFDSRSELIRKIKRYRNENRRLRRRVYRGEAAIRENKELRRFLDLPEAKGFAIKPAEILQRNLSGWEQTLRINRGSNEGLEADQLAVQLQGDSWVVRGKVFTAAADHSVIILSSDPRFKIGVQLEGVLGRQFVAKGWGHRGLRIENFPPFLSVQRGVQVYSAPSSTIAPRQFSVGRVTHVKSTNEDEIGRRVKINPPHYTESNLIWVVTNGG